MGNHIIDWNKYCREGHLLGRSLQRQAEHFFSSSYIQTRSTAATGLYSFLTTLSHQELTVFLSLTGNNAQSGIRDRFFVEVLLHCLEETNADSKRPILFAIHYIISKNEKSREIVNGKRSLIEKYATCDNNNINSVARHILDALGLPFHFPETSQFVFKRNETFDFYNQFKMIVERTVGYIWYFDNYADENILLYISSHADTSQIREVRVLLCSKASKAKERLELAAREFRKQYTHINVEIRISNNCHDRFLVSESEVWVLGPSLKDAATKACTISEYKNEAAVELRSYFAEEWDKATT